jgi:PKD repeat protein
VNLSWDTNIDPDVDIYQVLRADPDTADGPQLLQGVLAPTVIYTDSAGTPGKNYRYFVRARNEAGYGGASEASAIRELAAPNVSASDGGFEDYVHVQWDAVEGAVNGYQVFSATSDSGTPALIGEVDSATLSYDDDTPALGDPRWYWVKALGEDTDSQQGGPDRGMRLQLNPVQATATDGDFPDHVQITWGGDTSPGLQSYRIYRADDDAGTGQVLCAGSVPPFVTTYSYIAADGCPWNTQNYYAVTAVIAGFEQPINYALGDQGYRGLATPQGVNVSWDAVNNATRYAVYRMTAPGIPTGANFIGEVSSPMTDYYDDTAAWEGIEGVHYYYYIAARWAGPDSEQSAFGGPAEGWRGIDIPQNVAASDGAYSDQVAVAWDTVAQAASYKVYRNPSDAGFPATVNAPLTALYDDTVTSGVDYSYSVSACVADGEGAQSSADTGFANQPPVADIQADVTSGCTPLTVSFDASLSTDTDGTIEKYEWDFDGDGTYDEDTGSTSTVQHEYTTSGNFIGTVRVSDDRGATGEDSIEISAVHWEGLTVDSSSYSGSFSSLIVANGNPAISYRDTTNGYLMFVRATSADGSAWDDPVMVDSVGDVGYFTSLAVVDGYPAISYYDDTDDDLMYVRATNPDGSAWGATQAVDTTGSVGSCTSLEVVDGNPAISYQSTSSMDLKYIRATDSVGSVWGAPLTVYSTGSVGWYTSLAVVDGYPAISYLDTTTFLSYDLMYVRATDSAGSAWSAPVSVDNTVDVFGNSTSLVIVNGYPAICYMERSNLDLRYVRATGVDGSTWGTPTTVDSVGEVGDYCSLALIDGYPAISYYDGSNCDMKYVQAANADGSSWNQPYTVDSVGNVGGFTSLAEINGNPAISY